MRFKVINSNLFRIPGNTHMLHLGTIAYGLREFLVMTCIEGEHKGKTYIEEVVLNTVDWTKDVFANLKFIDEDALAYDIAKFAEEKNLTNVPERLGELIDSGKSKWIL